MSGETTVDKRLWFDLPEIFRLAEHAASCTTFIGVGEDGRRPCLLVDTRSTGMIGSNGRSAEPAPDPVHAVHVDGAPDEPSDHRTPGSYLRLTHTDPDDEFWQGPALLDELCHAAARRACWFTIDVHTDATIDHATHHTREVTTAPAEATWAAAQVAAGDLGPYPAQVARGYHRPGGFVFARFRRDIAWIALDWRRQPADRRPAEGIRVAGEQVEVIRHPSTGRERVEALTADPGRWWRIDGDTWRWTLADDEVNAGRDEPLSQTWGPDGEQRCTACHAVNEFDGGDMPSMVGYGYDTWTRCRRCGSSTTTDPMFGAHHNPAPWPPAPDRQRELDAQAPPGTDDGTRS